MTGAKEGGYNPPISASFSQRRTGQSVFGQRISYSNTNRERKRGQKRQGSVFCSWEQWRNPVFQSNFSRKTGKNDFYSGKGENCQFFGFRLDSYCVFRSCYVLSLVHYGKNKREGICLFPCIVLASKLLRRGFCNSFPRTTPIPLLPIVFQPNIPRFRRIFPETQAKSAFYPSLGEKITVFWVTHCIYNSFLRIYHFTVPLQKRYEISSFQLHCGFIILFLKFLRLKPCLRLLQFAFIQSVSNQ